MGLEVVPVFYGVEASDVRYQKGRFEEAFQKHEKRFEQNSDKVKGWKDALVQVANVSGFDFKNKLEAKFVEHIAEQIHKMLIKRWPSSTKNLVGIDSRVMEVISLIDIGSNDDVRSIGIWGMGGIGKTTIAEAVYDAIRGKFEVSCFLANVREAREKNQIVEKQKELLAQANIGVNTDERDIQKRIETSLRTKKVFLVLDDVSDNIELKKLAREQDWFGLGSRIIITTRDISLLKIYKEPRTYEVSLLDHSESFDLFCLKAFKQKKPAKEYLDLSKEMVKYSDRLPLALEVLGSHLWERPIDEWQDAIAKIKSIPCNKIQETLKISYDGLDDMQRNIFPDIACFFKGMDRDYVMEVLQSCGYKAKIDIAILMERSLVKINKASNMRRIFIHESTKNVFDMHDLLQDMGRSIVIQNSANSLGKQSRLWSVEDIDFVLENNKGSEAIQDIVLLWEECRRVGLKPIYVGQQWSAEAFSNMTQLKLLILQRTGGAYISSLPTSLKVLHWWLCTLETLPLADQHYELVEIKVDGFLENLWHGKKFLRKLKHLDFCGGRLKQTPDLSEVSILQTLVLEGCVSLTEVHPSVVHHKSLTLLNLTGCRNLKALLGKLEMSSLNELILDDCSHFENLPEFGECMKSLTRLSLKRTSIKKLPTSLRCLVGLEDLNLSYCHLTEESFPLDFGHFPSLTDLDLTGNYFVNIPINIHDIPKLKCLKLNHCKELQCLPELPSSIRQLEVYECDSLKISEFNILSKVCGVFVSPSQDPSQVLLKVVISGSEIPSWFDHQQDGNSISIPCDDPQNERSGIALCFKVTCDALYWGRDFKFALGFCNGNNRVITKMITYTHRDQRNYLYIICLTNDYFSDGFHQGIGFKLSILDIDLATTVTVTSAARWVSKEDIEYLKTSEIEREIFYLSISSVEEMEQKDSKIFESDLMGSWEKHQSLP